MVMVAVVVMMVVVMVVVVKLMMVLARTNSGLASKGDSTPVKGTPEKIRHLTTTVIVDPRQNLGYRGV
ncbi:hypothetical protein RRG08_036285 [Elysia crispata]|uniref:Uncharacterized protein n=1 Tax=Elysia crispata TaxID=231223 RepID=A0AAE1DLE8_9GAST|nr:hypothetical protein RRG08_036285 [Elysia crispata]